MWSRPTFSTSLPSGKWLALASGQLALDPAGLEQAVYEALTTSEGHAGAGQLCED